MVKGFSVPCRGINGCVTALTQVRGAQKKAIALVQKARVKWASDGNNAISQAVNTFAGGANGTDPRSLGGLQANVLKQYSAMKAALLEMGVGGDIPDSPNFVFSRIARAS